MTAVAATGRVVLFEGFKELLLPFLDLTPLMPPKRLHYSKLLRRPCMLGADYRDIAAVFADEVADLDCTLEAQCMTKFDCPMFACILSSSLRDPTDSILQLRPAPLRDQIWRARILQEGFDDDGRFFRKWLVRYGVNWPHISPDTHHPALCGLVNRHEEFLEAWESHADRMDEEMEVEDALVVVTNMEVTHEGATVVRQALIDQRDLQPHQLVR